jgi:hypothetical protein
MHRRRRDSSLLFAARFIRLFAYGALSVVWVFYLIGAGLTESQTGLLLPGSNRRHSRARTTDSRWTATAGRVRSSLKARSLETPCRVRKRFSSPRRGSSRR